VPPPRIAPDCIGQREQPVAQPIAWLSAEHQACSSRTTTMRCTQDRRGASQTLDAGASAHPGRPAQTCADCRPASTPPPRSQSLLGTSARIRRPLTARWPGPTLKCCGPRSLLSDAGRRVRAICAQVEGAQLRALRSRNASQAAKDDDREAGQQVTGAGGRVERECDPRQHPTDRRAVRSQRER
jgi:hypothetical protein